MKRIVFFILLILAVTASSALAQDEVVRVDTELASFEVSVTDANGNPVKNLRPGDFRIFEDGVERSADFFSTYRKGRRGPPVVHRVRS
jgi:hypothetical protein